MNYYKDKLVSGSLRVKNGFWHMVISYYHIVTKKKIVNSKSTKLLVKCDSKREERENEALAKAMLYEYRVEETKKINDPRKVDEILFTDYMIKWLEVMKTSVEETTYNSYELVVQLGIIPYFEKLNLKLKEIKCAHIHDYYNYLIEERKLSPNTVIHHHANLKKAFKMAVQLEYLEYNIGDKIIRPKKIPFKATTLTTKEASHLFSLLKDTVLEIPVFLGMYGLRRSEIIGLTWDNIDFQNNTLTISNVVLATREKGKIKILFRNRTKTKKSYRSLPLVKELVTILKNLKKKQTMWREELGSAYNHKYDNYLCVDNFGNLVTPDNVTDYFRRLIDKLEFKKIRFHDLRHSCATILTILGSDLREIQKWLGHSSYNTTVDLYIHMDTIKIYKRQHITLKIYFLKTQKI